jgi:hypothetical protein
MKKAILLIAALLMIGSLAFAEYSIGCWGRTVFNMAGSNANGPIGVGWGPNWGGSGCTRMGVTLSFSSKTLSFKITEYFNGAPGGADALGDNGNFTMVNMYGTCKVIPDMLTIIVGRVMGDGFDDFRKNSPNPNSDLNNNLGRMSGWGLWLVFAPKDLGLEIAVNMMTPLPGSEGYSVSWQLLGGFNHPWNWETQLHNINVAASYNIPDILKITAAFMNQCADNSGADTRTANGTNESLYEIYGRIDLLAVQGLTLWVDGAYTGFETNTPSKLQLDLGFGYKIGDLGLFLAGKFMMPLETLAGNDMTIDARLEAQYTIKPITIGLCVGYGYNVTVGTNMQIEVQPYVSLDDINLRVAFDYLLNTDGTAGNWNVPVFFTFSF